MHLRDGPLVKLFQAQDRQQHYEYYCVNRDVQAKIDQTVHADSEDSQ